MIGSPWNPHFDQVIPGTATRYDGRRTDSSDRNQKGGFDAIRLPQHVQLVQIENAIGTNQLFAPGGGSDPIILTRKYRLVGAGHPISEEVSTYGILYDSPLIRSIRETGFCWWWRPSVPWLSGYPRVYYESDTIADFENYSFLSDESRDSSRGFRWRLGAGFDHGAAGQSEDAPVLKPSDWGNVWSLWLTDDLPRNDLGTPEAWADIPGGSIVEGVDKGKTYPVYASIGDYNGSSVDGSRIISGIDLNRASKLVNLTTSLTETHVNIAPWYREA